jgi:hypothetical protein
MGAVDVQHGNLVQHFASGSAQDLTLRIGGVHFDAVDDVDQFTFSGQHLGVNDHRQRRHPAIQSGEHFPATVRAWLWRRFSGSAVGRWVGHFITPNSAGKSKIGNARQNRKTPIPNSACPLRGGGAESIRAIANSGIPQKRNRKRNRGILSVI